MVPRSRASLASWVARAAVLTGASLLLGQPAWSASADAASLSSQLQQALNADDNVEALSALMDPEQAATLLDSFRRFSSRFPVTRWRVSPGEATEDGRPTVKLAVTGTRQQDGLSYSFRAYQRLALSTTAGLITGQQVLSDQSVMTSAKKPLPISLMIPDTVLTGSRYDVDVVVDEPLGKALLAGGLTAVTPEQVLAQKSPIIQLAPLGGGGLFKSVQAPFQSGVQTWAALLVHPDGVITVSKQVQVVDDRQQLMP